MIRFVAAVLCLSTTAANGRDVRDPTFERVEIKSAASEWLPEILVDADGNEVSRDILRGKMLGIFFCASW